MWLRLLIVLRKIRSSSFADATGPVCVPGSVGRGSSPRQTWHPPRAAGRGRSDCEVVAVRGFRGREWSWRRRFVPGPPRSAARCSIPHDHDIWMSQGRPDDHNMRQCVSKMHCKCRVAQIMTFEIFICF